MSASDGGVIAGTRANAVAVDASGIGSLIPLDGMMLLNGAQGGARMDNCGLVKLGINTLINTGGGNNGTASFILTG